MKMELLSVFDRAAEAYGRPIFVATVGLGIRSFSDEVNRNVPENNLFAHAEDFVLYHLGSFFDDDGAFEIFPKPVPVVSAQSVKSVASEPERKPAG